MANGKPQVRPPVSGVCESLLPLSVVVGIHMSTFPLFSYIRPTSLYAFPPSAKLAKPASAVIWCDVCAGQSARTVCHFGRNPVARRWRTRKMTATKRANRTAGGHISRAGGFRWRHARRFKRGICTSAAG